MKKNIDWIKIKSGDEQEWSLLFSEHVDFLYSYGMKINRDSCVVKDVIQEVFISLYEKRNSLDDHERTGIFMSGSTLQTFGSTEKSPSSVYRGN